MLPIIKMRRVWFAFSATVTILSVLAVIFWGVKLSADFTGGSVFSFEFKDQKAIPAEIDKKLSEAGFKDYRIVVTGDKSFDLRAGEMAESDHQILAEVFKDAGEEKNFESRGPSVGQELKKTTLYAVFLSIVLIVLYVSWAFRGVAQFGKINAWTYGVITIIALAHDIIVLIGAFSLFGYIFKIEIDATFVAAMLTTLGYSVNDTIVSFDRIRENLIRGKKDETFEEVAERSVNETIARSFGTSFTSLLTLVAIYLFGGETIRYFVLALIVGVGFGTYSSIFLASPLLVFWEKRLREKA